jgi:excisionase family DNA binding protein
MVKSNPGKVGWRVQEWCDDVGVSRAYTYQLIAAKQIRTVKVGAARIIITSPRQFLESFDASGGDEEKDADSGSKGEAA